MADAELSRQWRMRNAERVRTYERERYQRRKDAKRVYIAEWYRKNPGARKRQNENRKQRMGGTLRNASLAERREMWQRQQGLCGICWTGMGEMEVDHWIPLCKGGPHDRTNTHLVHPQCNRLKGQSVV